jgi:hypothetical protein
VFLVNPYAFTQLWTPEQISTALWLDANDLSTITTVSGVVSQWNDKSGNAKHATQSSSTSRPLLSSNILNGRNVIAFDGLNDWLTCGVASDWSFLHNSTADIYAVWKVGSTSDPNAAYALYSTNIGTVTNSGSYIIYDDRASNSRNNAIAYAALTSANFILSASSNAYPPNQATVFNARINIPASASNRFSFYVNETFYAGTNSDASSAISGNPATPLRIGYYNGSSFFLAGYIAELAISRTLLSTTDRQRMAGYMAHKWGLTAGLPTDHPYKSAPPTI